MVIATCFDSFAGSSSGVCNTSVFVFFRSLLSDCFCLVICNNILNCLIHACCVLFIKWNIHDCLVCVLMCFCCEVMYICLVPRGGSGVYFLVVILSELSITGALVCIHTVCVTHCYTQYMYDPVTDACITYAWWWPSKGVETCSNYNLHK
jgi:hypothetical protein